MEPVDWEKEGRGVRTSCTGLSSGGLVTPVTSVNSPATPTTTPIDPTTTTTRRHAHPLRTTPSREHQRRFRYSRPRCPVPRHAGLKAVVLKKASRYCSARNEGYRGRDEKRDRNFSPYIRQFCEETFHPTPTHSAKETFHTTPTHFAKRKPSPYTHPLCWRNLPPYIHFAGGTFHPTPAHHPAHSLARLCAAAHDADPVLSLAAPVAHRAAVQHAAVLGWVRSRSRRSRRCRSISGGVRGRGL